MADIVANDIRIFNGNSVWISIKNNVKIYNGVSFIDAKDIRIGNGSGDFYKVTSGSFSVSQTTLNFRWDDFPVPVTFTAIPDNIVNLISKPSWAVVNINNIDNVVEIGFSSFQVGRSGSVVLRCDNGAPDVTIFVWQVS